MNNTPSSSDLSPSLLGETLAGNELKFLIRNGGYRKAMDIMDQSMHAHPDLESDPQYVPFIETLCLVLHEGGNILQADVMLDKLKAHLKTHDLPPSSTVEALERTLKNSVLYRNQGIMDPEFSGVEP